MRFRFGLATPLIAAALAGCGDAGMADLRSLVEREVEHPRPVAATAPDRVLAGVFDYAAVAERNPFEPYTDSVGGQASAAPDPARTRHPLERLPLGRLEMVGTLGGRGALLALIRDPTGITHPLAVGDYLGRDHGRIRRVGAAGIDIVELVADGRGGWVRRLRAIALCVTEDSQSGPDARPDQDKGDTEQ